MKSEVRPIDFVTKDYEGFRQLMIDLIPQYTPEWTDTSQSDFGIVLVELLANGLDILSYYQDKAFNENFLDTARTRKAIISLCRLLGYELSLQIPAVHKILFTKDAEYLDDAITINRGTQLSTNTTLGSPVIFELNEAVTIPAGVSQAFGYATQGTTVGEDVIGVTSGVPDEKFSLSYPDALVDTLVIMTNENGVLKKWTKVRDFLSSLPADMDYITRTDEYNNTTIQFGNGTSGLIPPKDSLVVATYRVGGGTIGNVGINTITEFTTSDIAGVSLTNPEIPYQYGEDVEDIEHAKLVAPKYYRSTEKAVTCKDFEDIALAQTGVSKACAVETFNAHGDLNIFIVPTYYDTVPTQLRDSIISAFNGVKIVNINPIILDPVYKDFSIEVNVIAYSNYLNSEIKAKVESMLLDAFAKGYIEFGEDIYVASIYKEIMSIEGIRNASIAKPLTDIVVADAEIARLTGVVVTVQGGADA